MAGITDELNAIKTLQQGLVNNKVSRFAYEQSAYTNNDVAGHSDYVASRANNIPTDSISVMEVNQTVVDKGFRARASSMPRMLLNHFFGRISYNLNKINDFFLSVLTSIINSIGQANGLVPLDNTGRIPYQYLPEDAIELKGTWNASTNTPTLADGTGTKGDTYIVSVAGTRDLGSGDIHFFVGDRVIYNGSVWQRFTSGDVKTVCDIAPDVNGNVSLSLQTDMTKIFPSSFLELLLQPLLGVNWLQGTGLSYASSVYFADNIWVAGSNRIYWSTDGKSWTQGTGISSQVNIVYFANGIWVAGAQDGGIYWSTDGKSWTQGTGISARVFTIYFANGIWVAGARDGGIYWSTDGKSWTQGTGGISSLDDVNSVYFADGLWVAGTDYAVYWSTDGKAWTRGTGIDIYSRVYSIYFANGIWVAGTLNTGIYWSTDGKAWIQGTGINSSTEVRSLYFANGIWVAGTYNEGAYWSVDGKVWTQGTGISTDMCYVFSIYFAINLWVIGTNKGAYWSVDGKAWTQGTGINSFTEVHSFCLANNLLVASSYYSDWRAVANYFAEGGTV